jgi:hypothetical protein
MKQSSYWAPLVAFACLFSSGCLSRQVAEDGKGLRHAVLDMYTDQLMDNLIRAHSDMPFVQLAYSGLTVQDTDQLRGEAAAGGHIDRTQETGFTAAIARTLTRLTHHEFSVGGSAQREKQMSFTADPVTDQNDIYEAYITFAKNPALLVASDAPPPGPVHILKQCGKRYYWVPVEASQEFLALAMQTTFMRGPETAPPAAYERTILSLGEVQTAKEGDTINANLYFNEPLPNGAATAVVILDDGRKVRLQLFPLSKTTDDKPLREGEPTTRLRAQWSPKQAGFTDLNLKGRPIRIYSAEYPPEAATPSPALRPVVNELRRIRLNQSRNSVTR